MTRLYHVRGRMYCESCILRCRTKAEKDRAITLEVDGLECDRCARFGFPALTPTAKAIIDDTLPSGSRTSTFEVDGVIFVHGGNADPTLQPYGYKKADVVVAQRRLRNVGVDLSLDAVAALLCRAQTQREEGSDLRGR